MYAIYLINLKHILPVTVSICNKSAKNRIHLEKDITLKVVTR